MGTNTLSLLTDAQLDFVAQKLDDWTFKKGVLDVVDKPVYRMSLGMINKTVSDDIPDDLKDGIQAAIDKIIAADFTGAGAEAVEEALEFVASKEFKAKAAVTAILQLVKAALEAV